MTARRAFDPDDDERDDDTLAGFGSRGLPPEEPRGFWSRHRGGLAVLIALVVLLGGGGAVYYFGHDAFEGFFNVADYPGPGGEEVQVAIPKGSSLTAMGEILAKADVVKSGSAFTRAAAQEPEATKIQAGTYTLRKQIPAATAVDMLLDATNMVKNTFTLREGGNLTDFVGTMADKSGIEIEKFEKVLADIDSLGLPDWGQKSPEGFLFPDTYEIGADDDAASLVKLATDRFGSVASELDFAAKAKQLGVTPLEAVTIASIIEKEVFRPEDRPKVARVIYNRLDKKMKLQMDSTVAYAAGLEGTIWTTSEQRASDSPYNTYKHAGLPPGPIGAPGKAALEAAVAPAKGNWLFFVPVNLDTGETKFTSTAADHQKAVDQLHAWCAASEANRKKCA